jgi:spore coat protein CotH
LSLPGCVQIDRPAGWDDASHGDAAEPRYDKVFNVDDVHELHVKMKLEDAALMREDLIKHAAAGDDETDDPMYVEVDLREDGKVWRHVGMRYRGSLRAFLKSNLKLSLHFNFDHFEADHPKIDNQRFWGFKELLLSSNAADDSQVRQVFASEVFREQGIPAARAAFVRLYVDEGDGRERYWGLYTLLENPSDKTFLSEEFGDNDGSLYRPVDQLATFAQSNQKSFSLKRGTDAMSKIDATIAALHNPEEDAAAWRAKIEKTLDVELFLRWLAADTLLANRDSYGVTATNYFLYSDAKDGGRLKWIPWDANKTLETDLDSSRLPTAEAAIFHSDVGAEWPLIHRLLADPTYNQLYRTALAETSQGLFAQESAQARIRQLHALVAPYVVGEFRERSPYTLLDSPEDFQIDLDGENGLLNQIAYQHAILAEALGNGGE